VCWAQSRQSAKPFLQSSELGLPQPLTRRRLFPPPVLGGGAQWLAREGLGESQFDEGTYTVVLFIYTYFLVRGVTMNLLMLRGGALYTPYTTQSNNYWVH
jgi:hypothetical protein